MSRIIHAACGGAAASGLGEGLQIAPDDIVLLHDVLDCGPLTAFRDIASWQVMRKTFWETVIAEAAGPKTRRPRVSKQPLHDPLDRPKRLAEAEEIVLWIGTELGDQLTLAWMPQLLRVLGVGIERLRVVQFERTTTGSSIRTLGILPRDEFRTHPAPRPVDEAGLAYLDDAWSAVIEPTPDSLLRFLDTKAGSLPLLHAALGRILWRYPDLLSGVSRYEARLLANVRGHGPNAARIIGQSLTDVSRQEDDFVGDIWLFWRLKRFADPTLPHPAVTLIGNQTAMKDTEARLTPVGEKIVDGEANFVALNGIDDWVGGVHLDSKAGQVWFRRDDTLVPGSDAEMANRQIRDPGDSIR